MRKMCVFAALLCGFLVQVAAAQFVCRRADKPPVIDGRLNDAAWDRSDTGVDFMVYAGEAVLPVRALKQTAWKMLFDEENVYFGAVLREPEIWKLKAGSADVFRDDCIEVFLQFNPDAAEYHHLAASAGGRTHCGRKQNGVYSSYDPAGLSAMSCRGDGFWSVELAVPLRILGIDVRSLLSGKCRMNVCREDQVSNVYTTWSWGLYTAAGFHNPALFREILFDGQDSLPAAHGNCPSDVEEGILSNPSLLPGAAGAAPRRWKMEDGVGWETGGRGVTGSRSGLLVSQKTTLMNLAGNSYSAIVYYRSGEGRGSLLFDYEDIRGQAGTLSYDLPAAGEYTVRKIDVAFPSDLRVVSRVGIANKKEGVTGLAFLQLAAPTIRTFKYDPLARFKLGPEQAVYCPTLPEIGISPDMPLPLVWLCKNTFASQASGVDRNYRLVLDLPEGVEIQSYTDLGRRDSGITEMKNEPVRRPEGDYVRHVFSLRRIPADTSEVMIVTTRLGYGDERIGFYTFSWDGGSFPEGALGFKVIRMPRVTAPKRFITSLSFHVGPGNMMKPEAVAEYCRGFRQLGINTVSLFLVWQYGDNTAFSGKEFIPALIKQHLNVSALLDPFYGYWPDNLSQLSDAQAVGLDGKTLLRGGAPVMCPSHRGKFYRNWLELVRLQAKYGISWVEPDFEVYNGVERDLCFCPRCKQRFQVFLAEKCPGLSYRDPADVERKRDDKALHDAWWDFKNGLIEEWLVDTKKTLVDACRVYQAHSSPEPRVSFIHWIAAGLDWRRLAGSVDYIGSMIYAYLEPEPSPRSVADQLSDYSRMLGPARNKHLPCISPGERNMMVYPREAVKYQILEGAASGIRGFMLYYYQMMDGVAFKYMADAIRMIAPVEDIILDGTIEEVPTANTAVKIRRVVHPRGTVILVSEYSRGIVDVPWKETVEKSCDLVDLDTGERVAGLRKGENLVTVRLDKERVRLFLIGKR